MSRVIGFIDRNKTYHHKTCMRCNAIIEFLNKDIIHDDMGCEIICPNCGNSIKF